MRRHDGLILAMLFWTSPLLGSDLSFFGGWTQTGPLKDAAQRIDLDNFTLFGLRYEKTFGGVLGFENSLAYTGNSLVAKGEDTSPGIAYTSNLVVSVPSPTVAPFFTLGLGMLYKRGGSFPDVGTSFLTNYGFGVKVRQVIGAAGLRFDYRRFTLYDVLDGTVKTNEVSAGILFSF